MNAAQQKEIEERIKHYINNEVYLNQSCLVEKLLEESILNWDDVENAFDELDGSPQEIFEWWAVSDWLAEKLSEVNAPVIRCDYGDWWGRTTTGCALGKGDDLDKLVRSRFTTQEGDTV